MTITLCLTMQYTFLRFLEHCLHALHRIRHGCDQIKSSDRLKGHSRGPLGRVSYIFRGEDTADDRGC